MEGNIRWLGIGTWERGESIGVWGTWKMVSGGFHWDRDLCGDECEIYCYFVLTCAGGGGHGRFVLGFDC